MGLSPIVFTQLTHNFGTHKTDTLYIINLAYTSLISSKLMRLCFRAFKTKPIILSYLKSPIKSLITLPLCRMRWLSLCHLLMPVRHHVGKWDYFFILTRFLFFSNKTIYISHIGKVILHNLIRTFLWLATLWDIK